MSGEYILCAAIWYKEIPLKKEYEPSIVLPVNCDRGLVFCGHRHPQCIYTMCAVTGLRSVTFADDAVGEHEQGFLTNKNRFVDRNEAAKIARDANQLNDRVDWSKADFTKADLYSEDLY